MNAEMEARLQELLDKQEIREVLMRYCRGVDRRDRDLIESTFHPEAVDYEGGPKGKGMADSMLAMAPSDPCYTHFIGNQTIEVDGDRATSEAYFISVSELARDGEWYTRIRGGRYIDRLVRHEGGWKVISRLSTQDWGRLDRIAERIEMNDDHPRGVASREDAVYGLTIQPA